MAVYERSWRRYEGPQTAMASRFSVVTRYALADAFASRLFTAFYAVCFLPSVGGLFFIYLSHNASLLQTLGMPADMMNVLTSQFFMVLFSWQAIPAFLVTLIVSPSLISADLSHGALPLYLSRPINRPDYVIGKMAVLAILLSPMTWVMGLAIFGLQAYLEGGTWWVDNYRIGLGLSGRPHHLDRGDLGADPGHLGVGEIQTRGTGRALRHHLHPRRLRNRGERRHPDIDRRSRAPCPRHEQRRPVALRRPRLRAACRCTSIG